MVGARPTWGFSAVVWVDVQETPSVKKRKVAKGDWLQDLR